ncbi:8982_t:CDS:1, partial [Funneliformis caledonium]
PSHTTPNEIKETLYYRNEEPGYNFDKSRLFYPDVYWVTHWESNKHISGKDPLPDDYDLWVHVYDAPQKCGFST